MLGETIRDRKAERHERTRREVLDAAYAVAREAGVAGVTLQAVAKRVGMRAPSLYTYFDSKNAIYDAMFAEGNRELLALNERLGAEHADTPFPEKVKVFARGFLEFCFEDTARYTVMFQRTIPGFEPSPASYAIAVEVLGSLARTFEEAGITDPSAVDTFTAFTKGIAEQQLSNEPGGDRWFRLTDDIIDMWLARFYSPPNPSPRHTRRMRKEQEDGR